MKKIDSSGSTLIVLLLAVLIVALLTIYTVNKVYLNQTNQDIKDSGLENNSINQAPTLPSAQNQVDAVRNRVNQIQNDHNQNIDDILKK